MAAKDDLHSTPGVCLAKDAATKDYIFQQTMFRVKDPKASLDFYTRVMGMTLLAKFDFPEMKFTLYFLGYEPAEDVPQTAEEIVRKMNVLQLKHGLDFDDISH